MPPEMLSTQVDCPFCAVKEGRPCVPAGGGNDPMNHTERHVAYYEAHPEDVDAPPAR